jgi:hypothetical protein
VLEVLDVRNNRIADVAGVACIINLPALTQLFLEVNPSLAIHHLGLDSSSFCFYSFLTSAPF